jgi:hypothetical protein
MPIAALCRHSTRQAGEIHAERLRCQIRVSQFASLFVSFSVLWSKRSSFHRIACARGRPPKFATPQVCTSRVFGLESAGWAICRENVSSGAAQASPRPHRDGVRRALAAGSLHDFAPAA